LARRLSYRYPNDKDMSTAKSKYQSLIIALGIVVALVISLSAFADNASLQANGDGAGNGLSASNTVLKELKSIITVPALAPEVTLTEHRGGNGLY